MAENECLVLT
jgi:hypothetical protein